MGIKRKNTSRQLATTNKNKRRGEWPEGLLARGWMPEVEGSGGSTAWPQSRRAVARARGWAPCLPMSAGRAVSAFFRAPLQVRFFLWATLIPLPPYHKRVSHRFQLYPSLFSSFFKIGNRGILGNKYILAYRGVSLYPGVSVSGYGRIRVSSSIT